MYRHNCNSGRASQRIVFGVFLVALGLLSLLNNLGFIFIPSMWRLLWPAAIIWVGVNMIRRKPHGIRIRTSDFAPAREQTAESTASELNLSAILGGSQHKYSAGDFKNANITAIMGGVNLDLRDAGMQRGTATVDVFVFMGGLELFVPPDWTVESHVTPLLGGFEDKTNHPKEATKRVIIRGTVIMGGVDVKN